MIDVQNLTKYYGTVCAVDRIDLRIERGEIMGLLGPNGAGKTTTMRMLTGYLPPTSGTIRVKDYTIAEDSLRIRKLMGYLPESAPLYPEMLVYDYLGFVAKLRELRGMTAEGRIRELADMCGLNEVMHKPIGELSKGYKQRVGLAHAMMSDPEILVLDEPTSGLDPNQIVEIREIIRRIGKEKTVILSTHILSEAEATCDRVVIVHQGRIVADDSTDSLQSSVSGRQILTLHLQLADFSDVKRVLGGIAGVSDIRRMDEDDDVLRLRMQCGSETDLRPEIYRAVKAQDWILLAFQQERRNLEAVFRELTQENPA
ncbi:MAG: ABC transporter ATP-binding protein [Desulfobacteraceae bacterium]|jgi:ABC-2 type transport system ATP-binding protein|nr:ABC transporter ATP-binding protein [Desulfobacteraceae bacterium]